MTRQHFEAIARILNDAKHDSQPHIDYIAENLAMYFGSINPNFNREKFMNAVEKGY